MSEITYSRQGDYLIPDLTLPTEPELPLGRYALMHRDYLECCLLYLVQMPVQPARCQQIEIGHSLVLLQIIPVHQSVPAKRKLWLCR